MLFSPIVFMCRTFRGQWISVFIVFVLKFNDASNTQIQHANEGFDKDFGNFLRDLGSQVYRSKKMDVNNEIHTSTSNNSTIPTMPIKNFRRKQKYNTQKAILEDVLMMKLVSYYEDKYKLTHSEPTTTEKITLANANTKRNPLTKYNSYKYNVIDKEELLNSPIPTKNVAFGSNRKMLNDMTTMDEYQGPEVVIF